MDLVREIEQKTKYPFNRCIFAHCLSFIAENNYE